MEKRLLLNFQEFVIHVYKPKILCNLASPVWFIGTYRNLPGKVPLSSVNDFAVNHRIIAACQLVS